MLILQRRPGESLRIGEDIEVTVVAIEGGKIRLAISAPKDVTILRSELIGAQDANRDAAMEQPVPTELLSMLDTILPPAPSTQAPLSVKPLKPQELKKP